MKKGFATSAIIYTILLLFLVLMVGILNNLQNKKTVLDALKLDTIGALEKDTLNETLQNINGEYDIALTFGKLQSTHTVSNTVAIGDLSNKKVTVTKAEVEGILVLSESELFILNQYVVKSKFGFSIRITNSADLATQNLASKIAEYTLTAVVRIGDE